MSTSEIAKLESRWRENPNGLTFAPLAEAYRKQKDPQRALEILAPGLEKHPDYIPANIVLGRCHWDLNDLPAAERAFTHVLGLDGENVIALKALADISERLVRYDEAERRLETLLAVDRSNDEARAQLARIHDLQQQRAEGSAAVPEAEAAAAQVEAEPPLVSTLEPQPPEPALVEEPMAAPEALERTPEPPEPGEISSVEYIGWVARPDDLASAGVPLRVEDLETTPVPYTSEAEEPPAPPPEPPVESEPFATFDRPFVPPAFPDPDSFGLEQSEDIVLNVSGHSEYQTPSAVDDLLAQVTGTPAGIDNLRRDLAPPEPITSALPGFAAPVDDPFAPPGGAAPAGDVGPAAPAAPEPVADREPVGELDDAPPVGEPELVVTETMAEVFLRQGHLMEAITVYRELVRRSPGGEQLAGRLAELEARQAAASAPPPRPAYAARDTGGQSVAAFFQSLLQTQPDNLPPRWPARPEAPAAQPESVPDEGSATRPAGEPLSLGSVFGEEPPPVAPAVGRASGETPAPGSSGPGSFDDFFGSPPKSGAPTPPPATGRLHARSGDDLDQFHAWLQGLKR
jgi:Flp pilus assembly protein TadD